MNTTQSSARFLGAFYFAASLFSAAAAQPADPAVYGALPDVDEMAISPDGKTVAVLGAMNGEGVVIFDPIDDPEAKPTGVRVGSTNARRIEWGDNEHVLLLLSLSEDVRAVGGRTTIEFYRWLSVSSKTSKANRIFDNESGYYIADPGDYLAVKRDEPGKAIFARNSTRGRYRENETGSRMQSDSHFAYSTFTVDLESGGSRMKEMGEEDTVDWVAGPDGDPVARIDYNSDRELRELYVKRAGKNHLELVKTWPEPRGSGAVIGFHGLISGSRALAASFYGSGDTQSLVSVDPESGEITGTLFNNPDYDISAIVYDPLTASVTAVQYVDDLPRTYHLDETYRGLQDSLRKALPGAAPMIVSKSADGDRMIVEAVYTDHPKQFFLYDRKERRLDMLAPSYNKLDGVVYAKKEKFDYVSADGLKIPGYLTVPANAGKKNMPLIVLPHGGPESRADGSFDYWSFFYAARGYLVYEPNFRGSDGYGYEYRTAGYGEWGRKMQDDITDGVKKLIADGVADPDRICIVGGSYGGYAALAGATLTPDLYACAVSVNGVSDLPEMLGDQSKRSPLSEDYWEVRMGASRFSPAELNAVSPAELAAQAGAPILLIHSKDDVVVPVAQSRMMRDALKSA